MGDADLDGMCNDDRFNSGYCWNRNVAHIVVDSPDCSCVCDVEVWEEVF